MQFYEQLDHHSYLIWTYKVIWIRYLEIKKSAVTTGNIDIIHWNSIFGKFFQQNPEIPVK